MSKSKHSYSPESHNGNHETQSSADARPERLTQSEIASRAYERWQHRGRPDGSAEEDWFEAEREVESQQAATQA